MIFLCFLDIVENDKEAFYNRRWKQDATEVGID